MALGARGRPGKHLAQRLYHPLDLAVGQLRKERQRQRAARHVLAYRELPLAVPEALAVEAEQMNRREVRLRVDAALPQRPPRGRLPGFVGLAKRL